MGTAGLRDFPLTVMYHVGTLEATPRELLQEILSSVGQQAYKPRSHLQIFHWSLISLHLKLSLKENVAPGQSYECFMDYCKHYPLRRKKARPCLGATWEYSSGPWESHSIECTQAAEVAWWVCMFRKAQWRHPRGLCTVVDWFPSLSTLSKCCPVFRPCPSCLALSLLYLNFYLFMPVPLFCLTYFPLSPLLFSPRSWPFLTSLFSPFLSLIIQCFLSCLIWIDSCD